MLLHNAAVIFMCSLLALPYVCDLKLVHTAIRVRNGTLGVTFDECIYIGRKEQHLCFP